MVIAWTSRSNEGYSSMAARCDRELDMKEDVRSPGQPMAQPLPWFLLALLLSSLLLDTISLIANAGLYAAVSYWILSGAIASALVVAVLRLRDWSSTPLDEPEWGLTLWRALSTLLIVILTGSSWSLRSAHANELGSMPILLSILATGVAL